MRGVVLLCVLAACGEVKEPAGSIDAPCTDTDNDTVCDTADTCATGNDRLDGDNDTVANACDRCSGFDDRADADADTVPNGCDNCTDADDRIDENMNGIPDGCDLQTRILELKIVGTNKWRGWHSNVANHQSVNDYVIAGDLGTSNYNGYLVFSAANFTAHSIKSVTLELELELYQTPDATETLSVWDVSTPTATLEADATSIPIYMDLMTGASYGTHTFAAAQVNTTMTIPLAPQAATDLQARLGQDFAIGVHLDTAPAWVRFSMDEVRIQRLVVTYLAAN
jgi:hypothetical protein